LKVAFGCSSISHFIFSALELVKQEMQNKDTKLTNGVEKTIVYLQNLGKIFHKNESF